jgi:hypothetical protein
MALPPSSNWRIGDHLTFVDCYGERPKVGQVFQYAGPFSLVVMVGKTPYTISTSLVVEPDF